MAGERHLSFPGPVHLRRSLPIVDHLFCCRVEWCRNRHRRGEHKRRNDVDRAERSGRSSRARQHLVSHHAAVRRSWFHHRPIYADSKHGGDHHHQQWGSHLERGDGARGLLPNAGVQSCPTISNCIAVGSADESGNVVAASTDGYATWTAGTVPPAASGVGLDAVTCTGPRRCSSRGWLLRQQCGGLDDKQPGKYVDKSNQSRLRLLPTSSPSPVRAPTTAWPAGTGLTASSPRPTPAQPGQRNRCPPVPPPT